MEGDVTAGYHQYPHTHDRCRYMHTIKTSFDRCRFPPAFTDFIFLKDCLDETNEPDLLLDPHPVKKSHLLTDKDPLLGCVHWHLRWGSFIIIYNTSEQNRNIFSFPKNVRLNWFPLLLCLSSSLNHPIFTPDVTSALADLPELFLAAEFRGRVWHTHTTFLWANSNMMFGLVAESVANDGCCSATCCEAARKCRFVCISTIDYLYRQKNCKCSFRDHLSIERACSDVIRMQNLRAYI